MTFCTRFASILLVALLLIAGISHAEPTLTVEPHEATVGDPIKVRLTAPGFEHDEIAWPEMTTGVLGKLSIISSDTLYGRKAREYGGPSLIWTVAAFDTGYFATGDISLETPTGTITLPSDSVLISSVLTDSTGSEFRPLKAQEDLPVTLKDLLRWFGPWLLAALVLFLAWRIIRKLLKRKNDKSSVHDFVEDIPPYDEAVAALAKLKMDNPLAHGEMKEYVTRLSNIVKRLLERTHLKPVLEMTTWEVRRWLNDTRVLCDGADILHLLQEADRVKFAKGALDQGLSETLFANAEQIVLAYRPREPQPDEEAIITSGDNDINSDTDVANNIIGSANSKWRSNVSPTKVSETREVNHD